MQEMREVRLDPPLPCGAVREGRICGRPALVGAAVPEKRTRFGQRWIILPMCEECIQATADLYKNNSP